MHNKILTTPTKLNNGATAILYEKDVVLATWRNGDKQEFVTWRIYKNDKREVVIHGGEYYADIEMAYASFKKRVRGC